MCVCVVERARVMNSGSYWVLRGGLSSLLKALGMLICWNSRSSYNQAGKDNTPLTRSRVNIRKPSSQPACASADHSLQERPHCPHNTHTCRQCVRDWEHRHLIQLMNQRRGSKVTPWEQMLTLRTCCLSSVLGGFLEWWFLNELINLRFGKLDVARIVLRTFGVFHFQILNGKGPRKWQKPLQETPFLKYFFEKVIKQQIMKTFQN